MAQSAKKYGAVNMEDLSGILNNSANVMDACISKVLVRYALNIKISLEKAVLTCFIEWIDNRDVFYSVENYLEATYGDKDEIDRLCLFDSNGVFDDAEFESLDRNSEDGYDQSMEEEILNNARLILAAKNLCIALSNPNRIWNVGYTQGPSKIFAMISMDILLNIRNGNKSEYELLQFLIYCSLKSIIGQKDAYKSNMSFVFSRAFCSPNKKEKELIKKYSKQYHWGKIIMELQLHWGLKYYSYYTKGFYFSFRLTPERLAVYAEKHKVNVKIKAINQAKPQDRDNAIKIAIAELNERLTQ